MQPMIPLLIIAFCPGCLYLGSLIGGRHLWLPSFNMQAIVKHLDLLLVALLHGCLFTGALLVATSLALLVLLTAALLVTLALAASDARRLVEPAARAIDAAAANLRLARAVAIYAVLKTTVRTSLVLRPKIAALASRVRGLATGRRAYYMTNLPWRAERFAVVA